MTNEPVSPINRHERFAPHIALLCVQLFFGSWPIVGKFALKSMSGMTLASFRVCGAALLFIMLRHFRGSVHIKDKRDYVKLLFFSILGIVLNQVLFLTGLSLTTVINASILSATIPIFALIVGVIIGNDSLSLIKILGIILAACGVVYLMNPMNADFGGDYALGNLLLVLNTLCYGSYIAISKNVIKRYGTLTSIFWIFLFGAIIMLPIGFFFADTIDVSNLTPKLWLAIIYIIVFPTVLAYFLNAWALARVAPSVVAVYIYLQPLIAVVLAPILLPNEHWNPRAWVAMILIFSGLFFVTRQKKRMEIHTTMP